MVGGAALPRAERSREPAALALRVTAAAARARAAVPVRAVAAQRAGPEPAVARGVVLERGDAAGAAGGGGRGMVAPRGPVAEPRARAEQPPVAVGRRVAVAERRVAV